MLLIFGEFHFNVAKYQLEIVKLLNPFLWRLNLALKRKHTGIGLFLMKLISIFGFQIFFILILHIFTCVFCACLF